MKNMKLVVVLLLALSLVFAFGATALADEPAAPGEENLKLDAPADGAEVPAEGEEVPVEEAPVEEAPVEEAPVEEVPAEEEAFVIPVPEKVQLTKQALTVDGKAVDPVAYNIDGSNYFKLRDLAALLTGTGSQFNIGFDEETFVITLTKGEAYTPIEGDLAPIEDKSETCVPSTAKVALGENILQVYVYNIGGNNFFKLRDLGETVGFAVDYDEATATIIVTSEGYVAPEVPVETPVEEPVAEALGTFTINGVEFPITTPGEAATTKNHKDEDVAYVGFAFTALYADEIADDAAVTVTATDGYTVTCTGAELKASIVFTTYEEEANVGVAIAGKFIKDVATIAW